MLSPLFVDIMEFDWPLDLQLTQKKLAIRSSVFPTTPDLPPCLVGSLVALLGQILQRVKLPHFVTPYRSLFWFGFQKVNGGKFKFWYTNRGWFVVL